MNDKFDPRVVAGPFLGLIRACQQCVPCHLGGGAALSGVFLGHRTTRDIDLFCHSHEQFTELRRNITSLGRGVGVEIRVLRDAGTFSRCIASAGGGSVEVDLVEELVTDLEPSPPPVEGIVIESLADLRASKLTCILSRSEPRDLVDLLFLDRAGYPPEADVVLALRKDAGIDPGIIAWLLREFPVRPLPEMLLPLTEEELLTFREDLRGRFKRLAVPPDA